MHRAREDDFNDGAPKPKVRRSRWGQAPDEAAIEKGLESAPPSGMDLVPSLSQQPQIQPHVSVMGPPPVGGPPGIMMQQPGISVSNAMMLPQPGVAGMDLGAAAQAAREALEKAKKAAMFQKQIQEQMNRMKGGPNIGAAAAGQYARKLILDEFGRELTEEGKVAPIKHQVVSTLMVNQNKTNVEKDAQKILLEERKKALRSMKEAGSSEWFDNNLKLNKQKHDRRVKAFTFIEKDHYVKIEQKQQAFLKEREKMRQLAKDPKAMAELEAKKEAEAAEKEQEKIDRERLKSVKEVAKVPLVEWWDSMIVEEVVNVDNPYKIKGSKITHYVEHPVPIKPLAEKQVTNVMHLTPQERKKLRRLRRQERTQQIRDKIKMGIIAPPPPKVKMSNLMRVLGDEAIADPSLVERKVKMQIEQRKKEHEVRNELRRLPEAEKKEKKKLKWVEKAGDPVTVALYKIRELTGKRCLFKIEMNAQQFQLTGSCVMCPGIGTLVVVEGSARAVKRYKKLMLKRIKWKDDRKDEDEESDEEDEANDDDCVLVWEGIIKERNFKNWKSQTVKSDNEARKILAERGCEHYWDMLHRFRNTKDDI